MRLSVLRFAWLASVVLLAGHPVRAQRPASQPSIAASVFSSETLTPGTDEEALVTDSLLDTTEDQNAETTAVTEGLFTWGGVVDDEAGTEGEGEVVEGENLTNEPPTEETPLAEATVAEDPLVAEDEEMKEAEEEEAVKVTKDEGIQDKEAEEGVTEAATTTTAEAQAYAPSSSLRVCPGVCVANRISQYCEAALDVNELCRSGLRCCVSADLFFDVDTPPKEFVLLNPKKPEQQSPSPQAERPPPPPLPPRRRARPRPRRPRSRRPCTPAAPTAPTAPRPPTRPARSRRSVAAAARASPPSSPSCAMRSTARASAPAEASAASPRGVAPSPRLLRAAPRDRIPRPPPPPRRPHLLLPPPSLSIPCRCAPGRACPPSWPPSARSRPSSSRPPAATKGTSAATTGRGGDPRQRPAAPSPPRRPPPPLRGSPLQSAPSRPPSKRWRRSSHATTAHQALLSRPASPNAPRRTSSTPTDDHHHHHYDDTTTTTTTTRRATEAPDLRPECPGTCIQPFLSFTCFGNAEMTDAFKCKKSKTSCCSPKSALRELVRHDEFHNIARNDTAWRPPYDPNYPQPPYGGPGYEQPYDPAYERPPYEQPPYEQPPYEQPPYEQPPYEQPAYEQPPYEQPAYEQPPYEQPPYEQPYERPAFERPAYEQPPYEQPPYNKPYQPEQPYERPYPVSNVTQATPVIRTTKAPARSKYICGLKGTTGREARVVGGEDALPGEWCWQVALINSLNQYLCGGALIGTQWVLTAAHCVTNIVRSGDAIYVRVGDHDLTTKFGSPGAQTLRVATTYIHHNHNSQTLDNDIALLKLSGHAELKEGVCLACLPARGVNQVAGKRCVVTGYGYMGETGPIPLRVREAEVPVVSDNECVRKINAVTEKIFILPASSFCAGGESGHDACQGDGGGPLVCNVDGYYELSGLVSWGFGCGRQDVPGVYVKVSSFIGWINQIISVNNI
nr:protein masquerade-like isoform X2 [Penaeus vannamei]